MKSKGKSFYLGKLLIELLSTEMKSSFNTIVTPQLNDCGTMGILESSMSKDLSNYTSYDEDLVTYTSNF